MLTKSSLSALTLLPYSSHSTSFRMKLCLTMLYTKIFHISENNCNRDLLQWLRFISMILHIIWFSSLPLLCSFGNFQFMGYHRNSSKTTSLFRCSARVTEFVHCFPGSVCTGYKRHKYLPQPIILYLLFWWLWLKAQ